MAASITFTATAPNGETFTRTSPSMPYTHVLMTGNADSETWGPYSWHKSYAAAEKARGGKTGAYFTEHGYRSEIVEAVPTAVKGAAQVGDFPADKGWPEEAIDALIEAKNTPKAPKAKKGKQVKSNVTVYETAADALADLDLPEVPADPEPEADELPKSIAKGLKSVIGSSPREGNVPTDEQRQAAIQRELDAIEAQKQAKADAEAQRVSKNGRPATKRQLLGEAVHSVVYAALESGTLGLPEGMDEDAAREIIAKWLQYIPTPQTPGGWQPKA